MLNERWQLGLPGCLGLQRVMGEKCSQRRAQRRRCRVPMENSFPACLLLHAPWKNPAGSSLRSQEDVGVS